MNIRKITLLILILITSLGMSACQENKEMYSISYFDYMYTFIGINVYIYESEFDEIKEDIQNIYETYHNLTTSYDPLPENSEFLNNVYSINQNKGQRLEIDKALYDVLNQAKSYETLTNHYFDMTLGTPVKLWKALIEKTPEELQIGTRIYIHSYSDLVVEQTGVVLEIDDDQVTVDFGDVVESYLKDELLYEREVSTEDFNSTKALVDALDKDLATITLEEEGDNYFVTFQATSETIDLGAFTKGYATNLVKEYLIERGVEYFSISAGTSSISVGKNINRPDQNEVFVVSLTDPVFTGSFFNQYYGTINIKDTSIATSGNFEQYTLYEGQRYHHIISPMSYYPVNEYYALTIVGEDAGLLDALSTALYVMDFETLEAFMNEHQATLNIQVIAYLQDGTIYTFGDALNFEEKSS
jgi:thiamine biosynthesis lipoprotein